MCTYVYVLLYCVLFYLYLLCSRKANFYVLIDNKDSVFCLNSHTYCIVILSYRSFSSLLMCLDVKNIKKAKQNK